MFTKISKLIAFFAVFAACSPQGGSCFAGNLTGRNAPEIKVREWITKNPPEVKSLAERVYVVEFWATWCPPCRDSVPHMIALTDKYRDSGLVFIAISADKSASTVRKFVREKGINYHVGMDNGAAERFGINGYPTAFVINQRGKVVWQGHPADSRFERAIKKAISDGQQLVAKKPEKLAE